MALKIGKKHEEAVKLVDKSKTYPPRDAVTLAKQAAHTKFDETVELHMKMGVDPRHADQQVRGVSLLPNGLGKQVRVLVFAQGEADKVAQEAGADYVGSDELIKKIEDGWVEFDVAIATPDMMGRVGKLGRVIGRRGLMPNPRSGTVVPMEEEFSTELG
ncbi:MAG: rplA [Dehalococcoidia bacterium]|nr:rplA [Dehalococcoidia bacterium]